MNTRSSWALPDHHETHLRATQYLRTTDFTSAIAFNCVATVAKAARIRIRGSYASHRLAAADFEIYFAPAPITIITSLLKKVNAWTVDIASSLQPMT
jgi:hypothetical protein